MVALMLHKPVSTTLHYNFNESLFPHLYLMENFRMFCLCSFIFSFVRASSSLDSIAPSHSIRDGETIVSAGGTFELGFFSPGNSKNRYVGVWYKNISPLTVVWVANREIPVNNFSGVLKFNDHGVLLLLNATNSSVWSTSKSKAGENPIAQLLDSGNLVVKNGRGDADEENILWQSFDHPCDTLLPGMKLGRNLVTGLDRFLSSWKTVDDPSEGEYLLKLDLRGYPQVVQTKGRVIKARAGSWNGNGFTGYPLQKPNPVFKFYFVLNEKEVYYEYQMWNKSVLTRYIVNSFGIGQRFTWTSQTSSWELVSTSPSDQCENYAVCGGYSMCSMGTAPICACLKGFVPKKPEEWNVSYWSSGCALRTKLDCKSDGFQKYAGMKLPDTSSSWFSKNMSLDECQKSCLENCSCTAYANLDIRDGGSGCLLWFDDLIDMRQFPQGGQDIYIRLPASELDHVADNGHKYSKKKLLVGVAVGFVILVMGLMILGLTKDSWKNKLRSTAMAKIYYKKQHNNKLRKEDMDLPTFDLSTICQATNNFSSVNKLGEGGYGPVYKGILADGQELAVKRLSLSSGQGLEEFKNEVALIAKLQHRNLVKLLGCCIQGDEKLLIYEYMPNKSLDYFIFDQTRSKLLDWPNRYHIIGGIARGLLYLHQDSRLRIIHRDLKTSNILLDGYMNPKISDFGLARAFGGDQVEANTNRVVGTYGYMPPEYAVHGHFSVKSDIFSFGVIVLEIVSGKKNRGFSDPKHYLNLLGHAWRLWNEERPLDLTDEMLRERCTPSEVIRCIQVGLLCVQQKPEDRPDMASVVLMLNGEKLLPNPKLPGFYTGGEILEADSSSSNYNPFSQNEMSLTVLEAR